MSKQIILAGFVASLVMGMITMIYEGLFGTGFFAPIIFIAAAVLRSLQTLSTPVSFMLVPTIVGLMMHMLNSAILGTLFAVFVAPKLRNQMRLILSGIIYSLAVFIIMWFLVLPVIDPIMLKINGLVFAISHMMWGATLGYLICFNSKKINPR